LAPGEKVDFEAQNSLKMHRNGRRDKTPWISEFIDHYAVNMRIWLWASWQHQLKGILIWSTTYWNSKEASPEGYQQNPWEEAMSFVTRYGWPLGTNHLGKWRRQALLPGKP
jgi:hypothetical protein